MQEETMVKLGDTEERKRRRENHTSDEEQPTRRKPIRIQKRQRTVVSSPLVGSLHSSNLQHLQIPLPPSPPLSPSPLVTSTNSSSLGSPLFTPWPGRQNANFESTSPSSNNFLLRSVTETRRRRYDQTGSTEEAQNGEFDWKKWFVEILDGSSNRGDVVLGIKETEGSQNDSDAARKGCDSSTENNPFTLPSGRGNVKSRRPDYLVALYTFKGERAGDLAFRVGDRIKVVKRTTTIEDWWEGQLDDGSRGLFPRNYCEIKAGDMEDLPLSLEHNGDADMEEGEIVEEYDPPTHIKDQPLANLKLQAFRPTTQFHEEKGVVYSPGMYLYGKSHSQATLGSNLAIDYMHKKYQSKDDDTTHAPLPRTVVLPSPPSQPTANAPLPSSWHSLAPGPASSPLATFPITSTASSNIAPPTTTPTVTHLWNALTASAAEEKTILVELGNVIPDLSTVRLDLIIIKMRRSEYLGDAVLKKNPVPIGA